MFFHQVHAADGAGAGLIAHDLRVHGADVVRMGVSAVRLKQVDRYGVLRNGRWICRVRSAPGQQQHGQQQHGQQLRAGANWQVAKGCFVHL